MTLEELRAALTSNGRAAHIKLDGGVHLVTETMAVGRSGVCVSGEVGTVLMRGKLADGSLFKGPLFAVGNQNDIEFRDLLIDGGRFEQSTGGTFDHRHPLNSDPAAAEFPCAARLPAPECFDPRHFNSDVQAELLLVDARVVRLINVIVRNSMTVGVAVGPGCRDVRLEQVQLERCGQFGLWVGAALHTRPVLPVQADVQERLPSGVVTVDCTFARCGAAGMFLEGRGILVERCVFDTNHIDFPFNESGGQMVIDYKSQDVTVRECRFTGRAFVRRAAAHAGLKDQEFGSVAIEASGERLKFIDTVVTGVAREAIHLNGARRVEISGEGTRLEGNHQGRADAGGWLQSGATQNISITTTSEMAHLGAMAGDITVNDVRSENGVVAWSNGTVPGLRIDRVRIARNNLTGPDGKGGGVAIGANPDGSSVRGSGWDVEG